MSKLKLEEIQVESYATETVGGERGTVVAHEDATAFVKCYTNWGPTCYVTSPCTVC